MSLKKLPTKSGVHSSPLLHFRKPEFFHAFSVIWQHKKYRTCMEDVVKSGKGLLCTPHLVYKLKFAKGKWWIYSIRKNKLTLNSDTNFWIPRYLVLITQHALTTVKGSKVCIWIIMSSVMITTFSFKILHNLLSRYTSGPGPSAIAWPHLLEFSRPILRHTLRCSKNRFLILKKSEKLKD